MLWVDYAKGLGIILVVFEHVARGLVSANIRGDELTFRLIDNLIYSFHMPLFFFLSGLFFVKSFRNRDRFGFVASKVRTIFYPYAVWSLLQGFIEVAMSKYTNGRLELQDVLAFLWQPRAQFWFLYTLFFVFLFAAFVDSSIKFFQSGVLFLVGVLLYFFREWIPTYWVLGLVSIYFVFFAGGVLFLKFFDSVRTNISWFFLFAFFLVVVVQYFYQFVLRANYSQFDAWFFVVAFISIMFVVSFSILLEKVFGTSLVFLSCLGRRSMYIYLMHILAGSGARIVLAKALGVTSYSLHLVVGTIVGIVVPVVVFHFFERFGIKFVFVPPGKDVSS